VSHRRSQAVHGGAEPLLNGWWERGDQPPLEREAILEKRLLEPAVQHALAVPLLLVVVGEPSTELTR
jgi:hypothetical protein